MQFSPDGNKLFSGARKDSVIQCWDMRWPGRILYTFDRPVTTNQRIYFDLDKNGHWLVSGISSGAIRVWNLQEICANSEETPIAANFEFPAHKSMANGISLNPLLPLIASASGQRVFRSPMSDSSDEDSGNYERAAAIHKKFDNSLKFWWAGKVGD